MFGKGLTKELKRVRCNVRVPNIPNTRKGKKFLNRVFTCNSTKLTSVPIIAYNSNVYFARNDPFSHLRSHM